MSLYGTIMGTALSIAGSKATGLKKAQGISTLVNPALGAISGYLSRAYEKSVGKISNKLRKKQYAKTMADLGSAEQGVVAQQGLQRGNIGLLKTEQEKEGMLTASDFLRRGIAGGAVAGRLRKKLVEKQGQEMNIEQEQLNALQRQQDEINRERQLAVAQRKAEHKLKKKKKWYN